MKNLYHFHILFILISLILVNNERGLSQAVQQKNDSNSVRQRMPFDFGWLFSLGHAYETDRDFGNGTSYFSYFTKTGYGDGAASKDFDDRAWRKIDLPHDWAVELPFSNKGGHSHGYRAIGRNFPENSIGWYRKSFFIPESDLGKKISIEFDGVHRNSIVWINGFYAGEEHNGYINFCYDISDYLNYGGDNVIAVRVDATMEEGWYYEGAGIYRHAWLTITDPLHLSYNGTFVSSEITNNLALITARTTIVNESKDPVSFDIENIIIDADNKVITTSVLNHQSLKPGDEKEFYSSLKIENPKLWSLENPYLHKLITVVKTGNIIKDQYTTTFGVRTVRFDPNEGFFLNEKHFKLKGTNNHQDHAGVGTALPDRLQEYRIAKLKEMGSNAYRCSHNPPTPELLDACDRLGMLVIDENRLMGSNKEHLNALQRMMFRDRNHPSVIIWSLGNEEWAIEGNEKGARIASTMQAFAQRLDSTRRFTTAISGGWGNGISTVIDVMGFNYLSHGNIDEHHKKFPNQPAIGTEETSAQGTRGIYFDDNANAHAASYGRNSIGQSIETGWKFYDERSFLAGLFYWTGFDYRGESNPFGWPAVSSQFGILDVCGFPKDDFYYLKSWWTDKPVLHILPHWNWQGKEGQEISVWTYSNCEEVELFLNKKSYGRKLMPKNGHIEWLVKFKPGSLIAHGYKNKKLIITGQIETTGNSSSIQLKSNSYQLKADGKDISVITVQINDQKGRIVPVANNEVTFSIEGTGKIIGVGNGDPSSHEPDKYFEKISLVKIENLKFQAIDGLVNRPEIVPDFDDTKWLNELKTKDFDDGKVKDTTKAIAIRGTFSISDISSDMLLKLFSKSICEEQAIYINGQLIAKNIKRNAPDQAYKIENSILKSGKNNYVVIGTPLVKKTRWENLNTDPGIIQLIVPAGLWKRNTFNGLGQIIIQSTQQAGEITLKASSPGLLPAVLKIQSK